MSFVVTKSSLPVLVCPSEPTPDGNLRLTSTDKSRLCLSFTSFHVFERQIHEPAETIRRALSHALVHYYPVAGRLTVGTGGDRDVQLACTGQGVLFVAATANCTLENVKFLDAPLVIPLDDLAVWYGGRCQMSDPLLMMQVTEFACGGYVVGVTFNHIIADGFGMAQFLQAVGELARALPSPSVVPVRHDESFPDIPQLFTALGQPLSGSKCVDFAYSDVTIPWSFINRIKAEFQAHAAGQSCSVFEVVTAAIWQCRTRAINADPDGHVPIGFTVNVRKNVRAKHGYYGNCITSQLVTATSGALGKSDVVDVVKLLKDAKKRIPDTLKNEGALVLDEDIVSALCGYRAMFMSSWRGIGHDSIDFGGGRPARVMPYMERRALPLCFPCVPCSRKDDDGVNVIAFCVTEEHVERFHAELARLR